MDFSSYSERDTQTEQLVESLNLLLDNIEIPLQLETLYDLTPSLLLMILENCLKSRLPLPDKLRKVQTLESKIEVIKIFLGVLGHDVLQLDLSNVDPRGVAEGDLEELIYVGELLITASKNLGLLGEEQIIDADSLVSFSVNDIDHPTALDFSALEIDARGRTPLTKVPSPTRSIHNPLTYRSPLAPMSPDTTIKPSSSRLPERQSTPPPTPSAGFPRSAKPDHPLRYEDSVQSVCTCALQENLTSSTIHCHCDVHSCTDGASTTSFDDTCDEADETVTDIWSKSTNTHYSRGFNGLVARKYGWNTRSAGVHNRPSRISDEFLQLRSGSSVD